MLPRVTIFVVLGQTGVFVVATLCCWSASVFIGEVRCGNGRFMCNGPLCCQAEKCRTYHILETLANLSLYILM